MSWPPVTTAMSCEHRLATIAEAGSLHRAALDVAAELVHHEGGERFAVDVFRDDQRADGPLCDVFSRTGRMSLTAEIFFSWIRMNGFSKVTVHRARIGHEVRGEVALVELHALDEFTRGLEATCPLRR
jgi:hypothetical protein